jgi:hypothetical protein
MLKHSRVTGIMDVGRLAQAVSMPGIDPRPHPSMGIVTAVGNDDEGFFADVTLAPSMVDVTCRVGSSYAGPDYGENSPLDVDDEVVVVIPDGDPAHGGVVVARMWSASDAPPADAGNFPTDRVTVISPGKNWRIGVSGGGQIFVGQTQATDAMVLGTTYRAAEDQRFAAMDAMALALAQLVNALSAAAPTFTGTPQQIAAFAAAVLAVANTLAAYNGATETWSAQAAAGEFLSTSAAVGK